MESDDNPHRLTKEEKKLKLPRYCDRKRNEVRYPIATLPLKLEKNFIFRVPKPKISNKFNTYAKDSFPACDQGNRVIKPTNFHPFQQNTTVRKSAPSYLHLRRSDEFDNTVSRNYSDGIPLNFSVSHLKSIQDNDKKEQPAPLLTTLSKKYYSSPQERDRYAKTFQYTSETKNSFNETEMRRRIQSVKHLPVSLSYKQEFDLRKSLNNHSSTFNLNSERKNKYQFDYTKHVEFIREKPDFETISRKMNQIPGYSGNVNGTNSLYFDEKKETNKPFSILRTEQPKIYQADRTTDIPGYTGKRHYTHITI
ncbi:hypothetical protein SNEBB_008464 [Seison nebaliae]|nr:hypothetical protein SNEBB_008464 [Seison nebaliae]